MNSSRSAIVTVAFGHSIERLDHTFTSFTLNRGVPLHAFIIGRELPKRRMENIEYHLVAPIPDFSHPLREIYFRRLELIDQLDVDFALVVDSYDVLCLQPLPAFERLLGDADLGACVEYQKGRTLLGSKYTANFLNCGVMFWNVSRSRDIRSKIVQRGRSHFRTITDDQYCLNEVVHTQYADRIRLLPCHYNYRLDIPKTINCLDGIKIYHHPWCIDAAKKLLPVKAVAELESLPQDSQKLTKNEMFRRRMKNRAMLWLDSYFL